MNMTESAILRGQVSAPTAAGAVRRFYEKVAQPNAALVIFFCSSHYDLNVVGAEMKSLFGDVPVVGCTTAGEIGPAGYLDGTISGASFPADRFVAVARHFDSLQTFDFNRGEAMVWQLLQDLESRAPGANAANTFAMLLIDGLSVREEPVARAFQFALGRIPLVGGSAGDGFNFKRARVYADGEFRADVAVLILVTTASPFKPFMSHHFAASPQRVVVTGADPARRMVHEIDGRPAADAYADLLGVTRGDLDRLRFAASPMAVVIGGTSYVRSISQALPDGSLQFFCAIDEGMVLRLTEATDLAADLERVFAALGDVLGEPEIVIGWDCILRRVEIQRNGLTHRVAEAMVAHRVVGFNTYGEQYRGVHVNQTFTGIAIGTDKAES